MATRVVGGRVWDEFGEECECVCCAEPGKGKLAERCCPIVNPTILLAVQSTYTTNRNPRAGIFPPSPPLRERGSVSSFLQVLLFPISFIRLEADSHPNAGHAKPNSRSAAITSGRCSLPLFYDVKSEFVEWFDGAGGSKLNTGLAARYPTGIRIMKGKERHKAPRPWDFEFN
jgi:hypothetical protein